MRRPTERPACALGLVSSPVDVTRPISEPESKGYKKMLISECKETSTAAAIMYDFNRCPSIQVQFKIRPMSAIMSRPGPLKPYGTLSMTFSGPLKMARRIPKSQTTLYFHTVLKDLEKSSAYLKEIIPFENLGLDTLELSPFKTSIGSFLRKLIIIYRFSLLLNLNQLIISCTETDLFAVGKLRPPIYA